MSFSDQTEQQSVGEGPLTPMSQVQSPAQSRLCVGLLREVNRPLQRQSCQNKPKSPTPVGPGRPLIRKELADANSCFRPKGRCNVECLFDYARKAVGWGELALNTLSPSAHTRPQQAQTPVPLSWKMKETANALCYALSQDTTNGRN